MVVKNVKGRALTGKKSDEIKLNKSFKQMLSNKPNSAAWIRFSLSFLKDYIKMLKSRVSADKVQDIMQEYAKTSISLSDYSNKLSNFYKGAKFLLEKVSE